MRTECGFGHYYSLNDFSTKKGKTTKDIKDCIFKTTHRSIEGIKEFMTS